MSHEDPRLPPHVIAPGHRHQDRSDPRMPVGPQDLQRHQWLIGEGFRSTAMPDPSRSPRQRSDGHLRLTAVLAVCAFGVLGAVAVVVAFLVVNRSDGDPASPVAAVTVTETASAAPATSTQDGPPPAPETVSPSEPGAFVSGIYQVGVDIAPGRYEYTVRGGATDFAAIYLCADKTCSPGDGLLAQSFMGEGGSTGHVDLGTARYIKIDATRAVKLLPAPSGSSPSDSATSSDPDPSDSYLGPTCDNFDMGGGYTPCN